MKRFLSTISCLALTALVLLTSANAAEDPVLYVDNELIPAELVRLVDTTLYVNVSAYLTSSGCTYSVDAYGSHAVVKGCIREGLEFVIDMYAGLHYISINGRYLYFVDGVVYEDDRMYLPVGVLTAMTNGNFYVDSDMYTYHAKSGSQMLLSGEEYYNDAVVDVMARTIYSEAGNQCIEGQIAVGNVILNRVVSDEFSNDLLAVVMSPGQFDGVTTDNFLKTPSDRSLIAAKIALEGTQVVPGALYFNTVGLNSWAHRTKEYLVTIEDHEFYR